MKNRGVVLPQAFYTKEQDRVASVRVVVGIPLYNHGKTVCNVVERVLAQTSHVFVLDDGSTDGGSDLLPVAVYRYPHAGKGAAICHGIKLAKELGYTHIITLDADGQHYPEQIPLFLAKIQENPKAFFVGARDFSVANVPFSSRFGRSFSNFWMRVQTGVRVLDMQCGFRSYPLAAFDTLFARECGYAFEIEILVRAAWQGYTIENVPISVYYPKKEERVSHFRAFADNCAISCLNARLTVRAMLPLPFVYRSSHFDRLYLSRPIHALRVLRKEVDPFSLAKSVAFSLGIGTLPFFGFQTILLLLSIGWFRLNRIAALLVVPLTWPPVVPGIGVFIGYRLRNGVWLEEFSLTTLGYEVYERFLDWIVGSFAFAPLLAFFSFILVFFAARFLR